MYRIIIRIILSKNDMKYNLINPFWLVNSVVMWVWMAEVDFGINFSIQTKSKRVKDVFRLIFRDLIGRIRWMIGGK